MRILDRYILKSFLVNYLLALSVLIGMYILLDLIVNFENFAKGAAPPAPPATVAVATTAPAGATATMPARIEPVASNAPLPPPAPPATPNVSAVSILADMADYYAYQLLVIFQQVSGAIPLLAAGFTMVRMTRHRELTAMLASGVSLYRVAAPIVGLSMAFSLLTVLNQEFLISQPYVIEKLLRKHDEVNQVAIRATALYFVVESNGSLLSAREYSPATPKAPAQMKGVFIIEREEGTPIGHISADSAEWVVAPYEGETRECWYMHGVIQEDDRGNVAPQQRVAQKVPNFLYRTKMSPTQLDLVFQKRAVDYLSSAQVRTLAEYSPKINQPLLYKIMHLRFTQPLMNIIMLLIGIPFLLTREPNRLIINMFYCVGVSGVVFIATFVLFQMAGTQLDPMTGAWLPVLIFGPFALVMLDFIQT